MPCRSSMADTATTSSVLPARGTPRSISPVGLVGAGREFERAAADSTPTARAVGPPACTTPIRTRRAPDGPYAASLVQMDKKIFWLGDVGITHSSHQKKPA